MKYRSLGFLLCSALGCLADEDTKSWQHPEPITYESLRTWHKEGGLKSYIWPKEHRADLKADGTEEVFLGISGYGRGMTYALFTKTKSGWVMLSDNIEGSHHEFTVLPEKHGVWHDFQALTPTGRCGLNEFIYTWNGSQYVQKHYREIPEKELFSK
jgi:hypothetical protein